MIMYHPEVQEDLVDQVIPVFHQNLVHLEVLAHLEVQLALDYLVSLLAQLVLDLHVHHDRLLIHGNLLNPVHRLALVGL